MYKKEDGYRTDEEEFGPVRKFNVEDSVAEIHFCTVYGMHEEDGDGSPGTDLRTTVDEHSIDIEDDEEIDPLFIDHSSNLN